MKTLLTRLTRKQKTDIIGYHAALRRNDTMRRFLVFVAATFLFCAFCGSAAVASDLYKGTKPVIPEIGIPKTRPDARVDGRAVDSLISGLKTVFEAGVSICRGITEPWIRAIMPDVNLPGWVYYLVASSVFTLILSTFLSVPIGVVFLFAALAGYVFIF